MISKSVSQVRLELDHRYIHGIDPGVDHGLNIRLRFRKKSTMYIYGPDYTGKSRIFFFMALCVAKRHGWKFLLFSPETGEASDVIALLTMMLCQSNKYLKDDRFGIPEDKRLEAEKFIQRHFRVVEYADTVEELYAECDRLRENNFEVDCLMLDPFNALSHELRGTDRDVYLGRWLTEFDRNAVENNRLNVIITHPGKQEQDVVEQDGKKIRYYAPADKRQIMWGQEWSRKGKNLLSLWRPPSNLRNENGEPYSEGYMLAEVQKRKPDEVGEIGKYEVYFNWKDNCYYNDRYFTDCPLHPKKEEKAIKKNDSFLDKIDNDLPF